MATKTLRALAREYAEGSVDKESYRKARDAYFKAVLAGTVKVEAIEYRPPVEIQDLDATVEKTTVRTSTEHTATGESNQPGDENITEFQKPQERTPASGSQPPYLLIITILLIFAAIGVSVALLVPPGEDHPGEAAEDMGSINQFTTDTNSTEEKTTDSDTPLPAPAAELLIEEFLVENNWSEDKLNQFRDDWQALSTDEQERGLASPLRVKLVNAIHQKLVEERALMGLGETEQVIGRQHKLVNFASELKISDPRLQVEDSAIAEEPEVPASETELSAP